MKTKNVVKRTHLSRLIMAALLAGMIGLNIVSMATAQEKAESQQAEPQVVIYSKDNAPDAPKLAELPLKESVTQYGITWTFKEPARVGQFVTGDYYVVGPVTVASVSPAPLVGDEVPDEQLDGTDKRNTGRGAARLRNGSMLNPPAASTMAFDSGIKNWYRADLNQTFPVDMKPGDSLVSTISLKLNENSKFVYHSSGKRGTHDNCPIKVAAVLTSVAEPQPADAFRPGYSDREQTIYLARNLRRNLLPKLERVDGAPDPVAYAEVFRKPWLNLGFFGFDQPMENMPHYGQWVGQSVGNAATLLCLDYAAEQKEPLLLNFVQVGIDYWGMVKSGHRGWEGWGGHGSGRKLPIVIAGHLLGDDKMAAPTKAFPKVLFGEDCQTRYGHAWTGAKVVFSGHSGLHGDKPPRGHWGPYEHLHPSQWNSKGQDNFRSEAYRRSNTSCAWVAQALALRVLNLEKQWNHDAFFDYVDRWMHEDDTEHRRVLASFTGDPNHVNPEKVWCHQGYTGDRWVKPAWEKHRSVSKAPTDGWKIDRGEQAAQFGPDAETTPRNEPKYDPDKVLQEWRDKQKK